jgi:DNA-binding transcriptional ArsR family regulator
VSDGPLDIWSVIVDHTAVPDHRRDRSPSRHGGDDIAAPDRPEGDGHSVPDYDLERTLEVSDADGLKAIADPVRSRILVLLGERAATTTELAEALERPKGTVGYHLKVLERAGLVRVVRTERVRALTAKYYGRTARTFVMTGPEEAEVLRPHHMLHDAMAQWVDDDLNFTTLRYARLDRARAREFGERLTALTEEYASQEPSGDDIFGVLVAQFRTDWRALPDRDAGNDPETDR